MIRENLEWEFAGIFADEGISGTSTSHREQFLAMIEKCKAGEIDLIITKQVSRFARNVLDSLNYIYMLRRMAGWTPEENWNVPAVREPEEDALIYDLKAARKPESRGGGWNVKRQREAEAAAAAEMEV